MSTRALLMVDAQRGFMPAEEGERLGVPGFGELAVPGGHEIVEPGLRLLGKYAMTGDTVVYTLDSHDPSEHIHFSEEPDFVDSWPRHCVGGTPGAELHPELAEQIATMPNAVEFRKGTEPLVEGGPDVTYTGYYARERAGMYLPRYLDSQGVDEIDVFGLATANCIEATAMDLLKRAGFKVNVITDAIRGVEPVSTRRALQEMAAAGIRMVTADQVIAEINAR